MGRKRCSKCGKTKVLSKFNRDVRYRLGVKGWCRDCESSYAKRPEIKAAAKKRWIEYMADPQNREYERIRSSKKYHKDPDKQKNSYLQRTMGVSLKEHRKTKRCLLCKRKTKLVADHNHNTNRYRGAICTICNLMVAWVERIPNALGKIERYLERG